MEKLYELKPSYVRLTGYATDTISKLVTIVPADKYPFKILDVSSRNETFFKYKLTERKPSEGGGYTLLIENLKKEQGRYMDILALSTDSNFQNKINIRVYGNILAPKKDSQEKASQSSP